MLCFHMQFPGQAWDRWLTKEENGLSHVKNDVLCQSRSIARSETLEESEKTIAALKDSEIWKTNTKFSTYISKYWLTVEEVGFLFLFHDNSLENLDAS